MKQITDLSNNFNQQEINKNGGQGEDQEKFPNINHRSYSKKNKQADLLDQIDQNELCSTLRKRKTRGLSSLSAQDQLDIVYEILVNLRSQKEVAQQYLVKPHLVSYLVNRSKKNKKALDEVFNKQDANQQQRENIANAARKILDQDGVILKAQQVQSKISETQQTSEPIELIRLVLRKDMGMTFKRIKRIPFRGNHQRCLVQRQEYSKRFFKYALEYDYIINIDETFIGETDFRRKKWKQRGSTNSLPLKSVEPRISLFIAISNKGEVYYSISQANTCKETKSLFLYDLALILDRERPMWRSNTLITMDNATYNTCPITVDKMKSLGMKVLFQGPYGYDVAPAELFFAQFKSAELNKDGAPTGKKQDKFSISY